MTIEEDLWVWLEMTQTVRVSNEIAVKIYHRQANKKIVGPRTTFETYTENFQLHSTWFWFIKGP